MAKPNHTLFFAQGNPKFEYADACILGVAFDENASYGKGASEAPAAIFEASCQMDIEHPITGKTLEKGIHNFGIIKPKTAGEMIKATGKQAKKCLKSKKLFILLGGDHSTVNGLLGAVPTNTTFVNFDAHLDLRETWQGNKMSHAAVSKRIFENGFKQLWLGVRDVINEEEIFFVSSQRFAKKIFYCPTMPKKIYKGKKFPEWKLKKNMLFGKATKRQLKAILSEIETEKVWLNIDIDCLDLSQGIETGTPMPFGLTLETLNELLFEICSKKHVLGSFLTERKRPELRGKFIQIWSEGLFVRKFINMMI